MNRDPSYWNAWATRLNDELQAQPDTAHARVKELFDAYFTASDIRDRLTFGARWGWTT